VVINKDIKAYFKKGRGAANTKKRWYYYSTNIPNLKEAPSTVFGYMSLSKSPTKAGFSGSRCERDSPEFQPSPS
jgi:hypothetical protein